MDNTPKAGDTHLHRYEVHKRIATRLRREAGVKTVIAEPSPMRPIRLIAALNRQIFFDQDLDGGEATLEIEWRPHSEQDEFRIQYSEAESPWSCGWHQDKTHENLGPSHFQVDHEEWPSAHRESASFTDGNPMAILEACLQELQHRVPNLPETARP